MAMSAKTKKVIKIVVNVLLWMFLAFALFTTIMALAAQGDSSGYPSLFGKYLLTVETDSMSPTFNPGDIIIGSKLSEAQKEKLKASDEGQKNGDAITFRADLDGDGKEELNTHRIIGVLKNEDGTVKEFVTKGDNERATVDNFHVTPAKIIAKWDGVRLNGIGNVLIFLQSSTGFLVCIVIPMALFFIYEVYKFISTLVAVKNEGKKVITAEDEALIRQKAVEEYLRQQAEQNKQSTTDTQNNDPPADGGST